MRYGSVCSGIEAASVAWKPLGFRPAWFSEIDPFCAEVLKHRHADAPNLGDMERLIHAKEIDREPIDILVGGTPCQSFSVAGLRGGLEDARGNLALVFLRIARRARPAWLVWENVPGVLSSNDGRDFGSILGGMAELGYGVCYRVLDAQYFALAQRRSRVFVIGYLGDWRPAAAVLFERASFAGHPAPSREAGQDVANTLTQGLANSRGATAGNNPGLKNAVLTDDVSRCLTMRMRMRIDGESETFVAHCLTASHDASPDGSGMGFPIVPVALAEKSGVRRLTPMEWERLQGFPDDYTLIPWGKGLASDARRYKAIGNSMPVPVMRWLGERIAETAAKQPKPAVPATNRRKRAARRRER